MTSSLVLCIAVIGIAIGIAVGAVGIGGVLIVPVLTMTLGLDVKRAIAAAMLSYLPACVVSVTLYARRGSIPWRDAWLMCLGALPAAYLGARATQLVSPHVLEAAIGVLLLAGGLYALRPPRIRTRPRPPLAGTVLVALGAGTGFLAAMTGAGGAFVLLPVLLLLEMPVLPAIGLGQVIALPISGLATVANVVAGYIDLWLAAGLAASFAIGIAIGTPIAHSLPQMLLRRILGVVVALAGTAMLVRVGIGR